MGDKTETALLEHSYFIQTKLNEMLVLGLFVPSAIKLGQGLRKTINEWVAHAPNTGAWIELNLDHITWWLAVHLPINSLAPGRFQFNFRKVIFKLTLVNGDWGISSKIALRWMPLDLTDEKSTLVQVMAWCRQATSHYLSQCWPRSMSPNGVTRPQWVNVQLLGQGSSLILFQPLLLT